MEESRIEKSLMAIIENDPTLLPMEPMSRNEKLLRLLYEKVSGLTGVDPDDVRVAVNNLAASNPALFSGYDDTGIRDLISAQSEEIAEITASKIVEEAKEYDLDVSNTSSGFGYTLKNGVISKKESSYLNTIKISNISQYAKFKVHAYTMKDYPVTLFDDADNCVYYKPIDNTSSQYVDIELDNIENASYMIITCTSSSSLKSTTAKGITSPVYGKTVKINETDLPLSTLYIIEQSFKNSEYVRNKPKEYSNDLSRLANSSQIHTIKDGNYLYFCGGRSIEKVDANNPKELVSNGKLDIVPIGSDATDLPTNMDEFYDSGNNFMVRSCDVTDDYIFVGMRYSKGIHPDGTHLYGGICVIDKETFTPIKTLWTNWINTSIKIHGNILAYGGQVMGLRFYDISNPTNIVKLSEIVYDEAVTTIESQMGSFIEKDGHLYYLNNGFAEAFSIYDITNVSNPQLVVRKTHKDIIGINGKKGSTREHILDYPYLYQTMAHQGTENELQDYRIEGVLVWDLSDISNPTSLGIAHIDEEDAQNFEDSGDPKPCKISRNGNVLLLPSWNGIYAFKIVDNIPRYFGHYKLDGKEITCINAISKDLAVMAISDSKSIKTYSLD